MKLFTTSIINRGGSGPLHVSRGSSGNPLHEAWLEAGQQVGNVDVDVLMLMLAFMLTWLGTGSHTKTDLFLEKSQTAFDPHPTLADCPAVSFRFV